MKQKSPCLALLYLAQDLEMPFCIGDGAAEPVPDEPEDGDSVALVGDVELLKGAFELLDRVELLNAPVSLSFPPPCCCTLAFVAATETGGGI